MGLLSQWRTCLGALALVGLLAAVPAPAQTTRTAAEADVKAAFVYNFARFVSWPDSGPSLQQAPFRIGVLGDPELASTLLRLLSGKTLQDRPLEVLAMSGVADLQATDVLYVSASHRRQLDDILRTVAGLPVLTVGDAEGFADNGGMVGLFEENRRMRFDVNLAAAERNGLKVRAQLLQLARQVRD